MIKYLGSKRRLLDRIVAGVMGVPGAASFVDLFSGTSRVGHAMKRAGFQVIANDYAHYAHVLATCYIQADAEDWLGPAESLIAALQATPPRPGYVTRTFCEEARFFTPGNGAKIDAIRAEIARRALEPELEAIAITSLMEAADRVDSTAGVHMAYLKRWAPRAARPLALRVPAILPRAREGRGEAHMLDAVEAARVLSGDVAYLDPPYNQHSYLANYHIWETLARWDAPPAYGVARKREDTRLRKSAFNLKPRHAEAVRDVVGNIDAGTVFVSFNDEGFMSPSEVIAMLAARGGGVLVCERELPRYVGAQIGVFNQRGERVGEAGRLRNKTFLLAAGSDTVLQAVSSALEQAGIVSSRC